ncbi:hypothetical protein AB6A23_23135 [Paenibacillus tarimensis]
MLKMKLDGYRFSGFHKSHIGALKSCLDYFNIPVSSAWIYGMSGNAFMTVVDDRLSAPNIGEPEEEMFTLARHLGLDIRGFHTFADKIEFERLQREAWAKARSALDQGLPVFAKELDLGNETSVVYGYDDTGYYSYSWHGGNGHEGSDNAIPWSKLGRNYCPCASCRERERSGEWANDGVYTGDPEEGGFISLHWVSPVEPSDDRTALRAALALALNHNKRGTYKWGGRTFYSGAAAFDRWMDSLRSNTIHGFYMGYFTDICHESRRFAHLFLSEAADRFDGVLSEELGRASEHYRQIQEAFRSLNQLFPWSQPHAPIEDPDRRREAIEALAGIRGLEIEAHDILEKLHDLCCSAD